MAYNRRKPLWDDRPASDLHPAGGEPANGPAGVSGECCSLARPSLAGLTSDQRECSWDEDGTLAMALRGTRNAFPAVHVQAVEAVRCGAPYAKLDYLICGAIPGNASR
ncbi:hypothetical protein HC928_11720 [bacterium]|nr:hypothetical protein [bacterium]